MTNLPQLTLLPDYDAGIRFLGVKVWSVDLKLLSEAKIGSGRDQTQTLTPFRNTAQPKPGWMVLSIKEARDPLAFVGPLPDYGEETGSLHINTHTALCPATQ